MTGSGRIQADIKSHVPIVCRVGRCVYRMTMMHCRLILPPDWPIARDMMSLPVSEMDAS